MSKVMYEHTDATITRLRPYNETDEISQVLVQAIDKSKDTTADQTDPEPSQAIILKGHSTDQSLP